MDLKKPKLNMSEALTKDTMPKISITFFDSDRSLIGIHCEVLTMCDGARPDKSLILNRYANISIGFIFFTIDVSIKLRGGN